VSFELLVKRIFEGEMLDTSQEKNALLVSRIFETEKLIISYEKNDFLLPRSFETGKFETCLQIRRTTAKKAQSHFRTG